ncbi:hypothetical protein GY45DRAFT_1294124 [Cubamyces sp. BRFM 1775]|nr:hypothetical protein GY45DRAFT_1294124 [Cubamyces sp. BRFM 1775]
MADTRVQTSSGSRPQPTTRLTLEGAASAAQLPFDIVHTLLDYTTIIDLVNFCSTCKALRAHLRSESIWRRACVPYGLRDFTYFGGQSAYTIYTQLLHPYAALVGLWASDSPFYGKVIEFRLFMGNEDEQGGIIGEAWTFPTRSPPDTPTPPSYTRVLKLSFDDDNDEDSSESSQCGSSSTAIPKIAPVRIFCDSLSPPSRHCSSLIRLSATPLGKFLQLHRKKVNLPDFPPHISPWYDRDRGLPRIPEIPEVTHHHREIIKIYPAARLPAVYIAPTAVMKPAAISIHCPRSHVGCVCQSRLVTTLPYDNLDERPPRYYPLRNLILPGTDPDSADWSVHDLDGIWYGSYGPNGTECIYLAHNDEHDTIEATKITGDLNVPRGCVSWIAHLPLGHQRAMAQGYWTSVRADGVEARRLLMGHGTIAGSGFTDMAIVELMAGVISADHIDIFWAELHEFRTYRRYKGRPQSP